MGLLDTIEAKLLALLAPVFRPIRPLVELFTKFRDSTLGIFGAVTKLVTDVEAEYEQIKNFKSRPQWKNRVISVPRAIDNIVALADVPSQVLTAVKDLIQQLKTRFPDSSFNLDELEGIEDLRGIFGKLGRRLAAGFEKVLGVAAIVVDALATIRATIDDLQSIVDSVRTVREDLENLDGLFLPQNNPRRVEQLTDGGSIKIRVGSLHS